MAPIKGSSRGTKSAELPPLSRYLLVRPDLHEVGQLRVMAIQNGPTAVAKGSENCLGVTSGHTIGACLNRSNIEKRHYRYQTSHNYRPRK